MKCKRRDVGAIVAGGLCIGVSGCVSRLFVDTPRTNFTGNISTEEPVITDTALESGDQYPYYYFKVIDSESEDETIRWSYLEDETPTLPNTLHDTSYETEILVLFGLLLPNTRRLNVENTQFDNNILRREYRVLDQRSGSSAVEVSTHISRLEFDGVVEEAEASVTF